MGKTLIKIDCVDQRLLVSTQPVIASGGRNEDVIEFTFCPLWDGFEKFAAFSRDLETVYRVPIRENQCTIPHEVLAEEGWIRFGVFGTDGDVLRTSEELKYHIEPGTPIDGIEPSEPTPDLWEQILNNAVSWNNLLDRPFGSEFSKELELYNKSVSFTDNKAEITTRLRGPLLAGKIYTLKAQPSASFTSYTYRCTAFVRYIGEKAYIVLGNMSLVPGLSDQTDSGEKIAFVIDPDNKLDKDGVCGWIFSDGSFEKPPTVTLTGRYEIITKLPKKFLPDDIEATGGVSSWNDLTDKPFGKTEVEILPETEVTFEYVEDAGIAVAFITPIALPEAGAECTVVYNGETYTCTYADGALGNIGVMMDGEDTGEPFIIMLESEPPFIVPLTEVASATVSIKGTTIEPIPPEYLPNDILFINIASSGTIGTTGSMVEALPHGVTFEQFKNAVDSHKRILMRVSTNISGLGSEFTPGFGDYKLFLDNVVDVTGTKSAYVGSIRFCNTCLYFRFLPAVDTGDLAVYANM